MTETVIRWKRDKTCPDCGKEVISGNSETLSEACSKMWRKLKGLSDQPCGLWAHAVKADGNSSLPHMKGRT